MIGLFWLAFKNQWSAQMKKPIEFFSSLLAIILNNSFYVYGIYLLAVLSVGGTSFASQEYLISTGMVMTSWGLLNVFFGGLFQLGTLIETGGLETFLAKPRHSLFLIAISKSNIVSIGEIAQGIATIVFAMFLYGFPLGLRALFSSAILTFAFAAIVILIGSFSFFSSKGSQLSSVILNVILTLSLFPVGSVLKGREKWILYLTPLLMTATLPRMATLTGALPLFLASFVATGFLFLISLKFFKFGLKKYQAKNYIFLNE